MPPRAIHRVADRRKSGHRLIAPRIAQRTNQSSVATHGVSADPAFLRGREMRFNQCRQFLHHIIMHAVMLSPRLLRCVQVKTCTQAEIPGAIRIIGTGQTRQPVQHRQPGALLGLGRQVHGKYHVATQYFRTVPVALVPATEAFLAGNIFQCHGQLQAFSCKPQVKAGMCFSRL